MCVLDGYKRIDRAFFITHSIPSHSTNTDQQVKQYRLHLQPAERRLNTKPFTCHPTTCHTLPTVTMRFALPAPARLIPTIILAIIASPWHTTSAMMPANAIAISYACRQHCQVHYQYCAASAGTSAAQPVYLRPGDDGLTDADDQ